MPAWTIAVLAVLLVLLAAAVSAGAWIGLRRRGLRKRFGPEYDRTVAARSSRRQADTELGERQRRVQNYPLREVSDTARKLYEAQWTDVQELFVESPAKAIADGQLLVEAVIQESGYPLAEFGQIAEDLSVRHASAVDHFRSAHEVSEKAAAGDASTEEIRVALLQYRQIFTELLGPVPIAGARAGEKASARAGEARGAVPGSAQGSVEAMSGQVQR